MAVSLILLCREGKDLPLHGPGTIRYPEAGAASLAKMEQDHFWFWARRKAIVRLLRSAGVKGSSGGPPRGLDIGCGTGFNAAFLTEAGLPTIGLDAYDSFQAVKQTGRAAGFLRGDLHGIEPEPEFDFVLLLDVIEHVADDAALVRQGLRCLKPGGVAVITVPALPSLWSAIDDASGHLRRYTKASMRELVSRLGGQVTLASQAYFFGVTWLPYVVSRARFRARATPVAAIDEREAAPGTLVNSVLKLALGAEALLLPYGLPLGTSLFASLRRA